MISVLGFTGTHRGLSIHQVHNLGAALRWYHDEDKSALSGVCCGDCVRPAGISSHNDVHFGVEARVDQACA